VGKTKEWFFHVVGHVPGNGEVEISVGNMPSYGFTAFEKAVRRPSSSYYSVIVVSEISCAEAWRQSSEGLFQRLLLTSFQGMSFH